MTLSLKEGIKIATKSRKYVTEEISTTSKKEMVALYHATGVTISVSVNAIIRIPNNLTQKTFEATDNQKGIIYAQNVDDLIESLES